MPASRVPVWCLVSACSLPVLVVFPIAAGCSSGSDGPAKSGFVGGNATPNAGTSSQGAAGSGSVLPVAAGTGSIQLNPTNGAGAGGNPCGTTIPVTYRDMKYSTEPGGHPDFERTTGQDDIGCGIVAPDLGPDHKPVFAASNGSGQRKIDAGGFAGCITPWPYTPSMTVVQNADTFSTWYNTSDFSKEVAGEIPLTETPAGSGKYVYASTEFFPIDAQGWGNGNAQHNFSFTTEVHLKFGYVKGQKFTFSGDDDLWIFVNNKLALDLGGCHQPLTGTIDFDAQAAALGIKPGSTYPMDIFHAERHTSASNFRIETNINCFQAVVYPPIK